MKKSRLLGAVCAGLAAVSFNVNAATIVDNGTYTTVDGVDWLDLTETADMSYNQVSAELGLGGTLEGWSYASRAQVAGLWTAFGGDPVHYDGWSTQNNGIFDIIAPLMGDLYCSNVAMCSPGDGYSFWLTGDSNGSERLFATSANNDIFGPESATQDYFTSHDEDSFVERGESHATLGSALFRNSIVPIPAAVWLFGSGLLGLIGVARRKVRV